MGFGVRSESGVPARGEELEMTARTGSVKPAAAIVSIAVVLLGVPGQASAQFGFGGGFGGFGYGGFGFSSVPKPESFLYSKSLIDASRPVNAPSRDVYANNPNSFINHLRDNGFVDRYSVDRREIPQYRYAARPRAREREVAPQSPSIPLSSFYNAENKLVWPGDSPLAGDMKQKREISDEACSTVLSETKQNGVAALASVTDARQKLLEYGRPALAHVRAHETPRIADTFHMFLLSLYESLAQTATPAATAAANARPANP
jgi:hypothetical protein